MQGFRWAAEPRPEDPVGAARVEGDIARAARRGRRTADCVRVASVRGGEEPGELVAAEGVTPRDVEDAGDVGRSELEQRRRDLVDARGRTDLVGVELDVVAERERLLRPERAVEQRGADGQRLGMQLADEPLGGELRVAVERDRTRLVVLRVPAFPLAVEDEVAREVNQPRVRAMRGERAVVRALDDGAPDLLVRLAVGRVDHDVGSMLQEDARGLVLVADVERDGTAVWRRAVQPRREDLVARLLGLPRDLGAEVARAAGDEDPHREVQAAVERASRPTSNNAASGAPPASRRIPRASGSSPAARL